VDCEEEEKTEEMPHFDILKSFELVHGVGGGLSILEDGLSPVMVIDGERCEQRRKKMTP
jgi:hypothetical protein